MDVDALARDIAGVRVHADGVLEILDSDEGSGDEAPNVERAKTMPSILPAMTMPVKSTPWVHADGVLKILDSDAGSGDEAPNVEMAKTLPSTLPAMTTPVKSTPTRRRARGPAAPPACGLRGADGWMRDAWEAEEKAALAAGRRARGWTFARARDGAGQALLRYFDEEVLNGVLKGRVELRWSSRLLKTAGVTYMLRDGGGSRRARVELSGKVVDDLERLYATLAHELCHAAAWVVNDVSRPPHGREFKAWAATFRGWDPALGITVCHEYEIQCRFVYTCQRCENVYGRHSRSIDTERKACGKCHGRLKLHVKKAAELRAEVSARAAERWTC